MMELPEYDVALKGGPGNEVTLGKALLGSATIGSLTVNGLEFPPVPFPPLALNPGSKRFDIGQRWRHSTPLFSHLKIFR